VATRTAPISNSRVSEDAQPRQARAADASAWGAGAAVAFLAILAITRLDHRLAYAAPVVAGIVTILIGNHTTHGRHTRATLAK
jgi:hypothetical protein